MIFKMHRNIFIILPLNFIFVISIDYQKPVPAKLWREHCKKNSHVLNDCNWCWCDSTHRYRCEARVCSQVDMFGHFNDAIKDIDVGMEGRGSWRSTESACAPGVHYRRGPILCICNEDGNWPNPVCRDTFRILHPIEVTQGIEVSRKCEATKLYLIGCNVCFCPSSGFLNSDFCTKTACSEDDPVINGTKEMRYKLNTDDELEVYATCVTNKKYSLGCQTCTCLRNNRLLCDNCTSIKKGKDQSQDPKNESSICNNYEVKEVFNIDCNYCFCDEKSLIYCTTRKCLKNVAITKLDFIELQLESTEAPIVDHDCKPGKKYMRDCNTCYCVNHNGEKTFSCTMKHCNIKNKVDLNEHDCVNRTKYEKNCLICRCDIEDGVKYQTCVVDRRCTRTGMDKEPHTVDIDVLHGYCQPLHVYKKDCNICQCLSNGKIMKCTTRNCTSPDHITVDLIPVKPKNPDSCPKGLSYKLDCNFCFCLNNGNAICTTNDCQTKYDDS